MTGQKIERENRFELIFIGRCGKTSWYDRSRGRIYPCEGV